MKNKYCVSHRVNIIKYLKYQIKRLCANLFSYQVKPINATIQTCFIVGCGHTGTTLMAAVLGKFKETLVLGRETGSFLPHYGIEGSKAIVEEWLYFSGILNKNIFIEKTPKHVHVTCRIEKIIPDSKFIVMVRNPLDTCASLYKRFNDLEFCIERYNMDHEASFNLSQKDNVLVIRYEDFTKDPGEIMQNICSFLNINYDEEVLIPSKTIYSDSTENGVVSMRKVQVEQEIKQNNGQYKKIFNDIQIAQILQKTAAVARKFKYNN
jgi:hypothetical protein